MKRMVLLLAVAAMAAASSGGPDGYGYTWADDADGVTYEWVSPDGGDTIIFPPPADDEAVSYSLPFPIRFYGVVYNIAYVSSNGLFAFLPDEANDYSNASIPDIATPNGYIALLWDDQIFGDSSNVIVEVVGTSPDRILVVTWDKVYFHDDYSLTDPIGYQLLIYESTGDNPIKIQYSDVISTGAFSQSSGKDGTVGIENASGDDGLLVSYDDSTLYAGHCIEITPPTPSEHDCAVVGIVADDTVLSSRPVSIGVMVVNLGSGDEGDVRVVLTVSDSLDAPVFSDTTTLALPVSVIDTIEFSGWFPATMGRHSIEAQIVCVGDGRADNDTAFSDMFVLGYDVEVVSINVPSVFIAGETLPLVAVFGNNGGEDLVDFPVNLAVQDSMGTTLFSIDSTVSIPSGDGRIVTFRDDWFPSAGDYTIIAIAEHPNDQIRSNDTLMQSLLVAEHISSGGPDAANYCWFDSYYADTFPYVPISLTGDVLPLSGDDEDTTIALPFSFLFYSTHYDSISISTNGFLSFQSIDGSYFSNYDIPTSSLPNALLSPLWDDLTVIDTVSQIITRYEAGDPAVFHIIYSNVFYLNDYGRMDSLTFEVVLYSDGRFAYNYESVESEHLPTHSMGVSATVGVENGDGTIGLCYEYDGVPAGNPVFSDFAIYFIPCESDTTPPPGDTTAPVIVEHFPDTLDIIPTTDITALSLAITDISPIAADTFYYRVEPATSFISVLPDSVPDDYWFTLTGLSDGDSIEWYAVAYDTAGNRALYPSPSGIAYIREHRHIGGPDGGDYTWIDNWTGMDSIAFDWVEIDPDLGGSGIVLVGVDDDWISEPVPMSDTGDSFPFYDGGYRYFRICSNGWITLDTTYTSPDHYGISALPDSTNPHLLVAALFDNLIPDSISHLIWLSDGERTIIEWRDFLYFSGSSDERLTFEIILDRSAGSSQIYLNYLSISGGAEAVVGIQNDDFSSGLLYRTGGYPSYAYLPKDSTTILFSGPGFESIAENERTIPNEFTLGAISPNPFNAVCAINIGIPSNGDVSLDVFDILGARVDSRTMRLAAGWQRILWRADAFPSGVYMMRFSFGGKVINTRVLLVK